MDAMEVKMASSLQHPFQCLAVARPPGADNTFLLAACGARLLSTSLGKDATQNEWSAAPAAHKTSATKPEVDERPAKKQKKSPAASATSNVIKLAISPANQHAVIVTEDKIVRVLEIHGDGTLIELSQRAMPKRPCAIQVTPDNATILCGDKFGDVYSLPLLPEERLEAPDATSGAGVEQLEETSQAFKPSATSTTVHTKRNRKALEAQLKQKNLTPKTKEPLKFEHKLLLGHVSMLTDLTFATREVEGEQRSYITTADRDEHIRVSRGPPQSHIIEGYCLGHTDFVNKICLVPGTNLLVSGGGDSWIGVWDWPSTKLEQRLDVLEILRAGLKEENTRLSRPLVNVEKMNVSGIWIVPMKVGECISNNKPVTEPAVVVACEGIPAILVCPAADLLTADAAFQPITGFLSPILDITSSEQIGIATLDDRKIGARHRMQSFRLERDKKSKTGMVEFLADDELFEPMNKLNDLPADLQDEKALNGLLYGVANLRKRGYQNGDQGSDVEGDAADEAQGVLDEAQEAD